MKTLPSRTGLVVLLILTTANASPVRAQAADGTLVSVAPYVGIGPVFDGGNLLAWTGNVLVAVEARRASWQGEVFGSVRGLGAECSDGCDLNGEALGAGVAFVPGPVGVGGGLGVLHQSGNWSLQPYALLSADRGPVRVQLRVDVPRGGYGVSVPILFGVRFPIR